MLKGRMILTSQEKIKWLSRYKVVNRKINDLTEELEQWRTRATKITPVLSQESRGSGNEDKLQSSVIKICELEEELEQKIRELLEQREKIVAVLNNLPNEQLRQLMRYRYIRGMTWDEIAIKMDYSRTQVCRLHGKALNKIEL